MSSIRGRWCITVMRAKKLIQEEEWKRLENCHEPIISKKEFLKVAEIRKLNTKNFTDGKRHARYCLVGKIKCSDCGHTLAHTYSSCLKYYCNKKYLDQSSGNCRTSILDADIKEVVLSMLQQYADLLVDMEHTLTILQQDFRASYEAYKIDIKDKDTYLEQKKMYDQMMEKLQENIEKQQVAVRQISNMDVPQAVGLEMLNGRIQLTKLTKEIVDTFVEEIVLFD